MQLVLDGEGIRTLIACLGDDGNLDTSAATMRKQWPMYSPIVQVLKDIAETLNELHKRDPDDKEGHIKAMMDVLSTDPQETGLAGTSSDHPVDRREIYARGFCPGFLAAAQVK